MEIRLIEPEERYLASYQEAVEEYRARQVETYGFTDAAQTDPLEKFRRSKLGIGLKPGRVPTTYWWLVSDDEFIGEIAIRHELNDSLLRYGGHIGYGVRYSRWNRGYGTVMLRMALEKAGEMGLKQVLITCDDDNIASARLIEKCGGILQDKIQNSEVLTRRYWVAI